MSGRATEADLKKAHIQVLNQDGSVDEEIPVHFNPTEYSLDKSVNYADQAIPGYSSPVVQFVSGEAETLTMELFFDTYEADEDVRTYTDKIDDLIRVDGDLHAPPILRFVWASLSFTSVLESAQTQFTMFQADGTPVRARVDVTFKEYTTPEEQQIEEPRQSADTDSVRVVTEGETLWGIANDEYGDPTEWRPIATANGIENPRSLEPGTRLSIPRLE